MNAVLDFFTNTFVPNTYFGKILTTMIISMMPIGELRFSIPYGTFCNLPVYVSAIFSVIGNMLPVPFVILFIRKIFEWLRSKSKKLDKIIGNFEARTMKKSGLVKKSTFIGLILFVAIPLPGTGAWTAAFIAAMLEVRLKIAIPAIFIGVVIASIIVSLAVQGVITIL